MRALPTTPAAVGAPSSREPCKSECCPETNRGRSVMRAAMLSCAFACAILGHTKLLGGSAAAGSGEAQQTQVVQAQPKLRLAQNTEAAGKSTTVTDGGQKLSADAQADGDGQVSVLAAAAKAEKGKEAPVPAVDEETLSLYPTA